MELLRPVLQEAASCVKPEPVDDPELMKAWWSAVQERNIERMRELIDRGVRVDAVSPAGKTALSYAAFHGEKAMVKLLFAHHANPSAKCAAYGSPLAASLYSQDEVIAQYLLDRRANPDDVDAKGMPVLAIALENRPDVANKLIRAGANLDWCDEGGNTPLLVALKYGQWKNALLLIRKGLDVNAANKEGFTPLMLAVSLSGAFGSSDVIDALFDAGAKIDACMPSGSTALMFAAVRDSSGETVKLLLDRGANPHVSCDKGSVVQMADQMGNERCVALLTEYAARSLHEKTIPSSDSSVGELRRL